MGRKTPVDAHSIGERISMGMRIISFDEMGAPGHRERGVRGRDTDDCLKRAEFIDKCVAKLPRTIPAWMDIQDRVS